MLPSTQPVFFGGGQVKFRRERIFNRVLNQLYHDGKYEFDFRDVSVAMKDLGLHDSIELRQIPMTLKCFKRELGIECVGKFPTGIGNGKRCRYRFIGLPREAM